MSRLVLLFPTLTGYMIAFLRKVLTERFNSWGQSPWLRRDKVDSGHLSRCGATHSSPIRITGAALQRNTSSRGHGPRSGWEKLKYRSDPFFWRTWVRLPKHRKVNRLEAVLLWYGPSTVPNVVPNSLVHDGLHSLINSRSSD